MIFIACPICKSGQFYVKDPSDPFEVYEFHLEDGGVRFDDAESEDDAPLIDGGQEIFCQRCSWHGKYESID